MVTTGIAIVAGEITTNAIVDYQTVVRQVINEVGYTDDRWGICGDTCAVMVAIDKQSPDIAVGVNNDDKAGKDIGAGDQGLMFGYACNETPELMPLPIALSHRITNRLTEARQNKEVNWLRPDSKSQVTVEYVDNKPVRIDTVVVSTQHNEDVTQEEIRDFVINKVILPSLPPELIKGNITYHINPTGRFVIGGPHGDCGLTGRKIIVDTYGGWGRHGGGAFSGKDPTKVDRSAAYMARHVAKNIVAAGLGGHARIDPDAVRHRPWFRGHPSAGGGGYLRPGHIDAADAGGGSGPVQMVRREADRGVNGTASRADEGARAVHGMLPERRGDEGDKGNREAGAARPGERRIAQAARLPGHERRQGRGLQSISVRSESAQSQGGADGILQQDAHRDGLSR
jgi:hypothetical protein